FTSSRASSRIMGRPKIAVQRGVGRRAGIRYSRLRREVAMALEMRANCEKCRAALPHEATAYICSYEGAFCADCSGGMEFVCPNWGGELLLRPRRKPK